MFQFGKVFDTLLVDYNNYIKINKANILSKIKHSGFPHLSLIITCICNLLAQERHKPSHAFAQHEDVY